MPYTDGLRRSGFTELSENLDTSNRLTKPREAYSGSANLRCGRVDLGIYLLAQYSTERLGRTDGGLQTPEMMPPLSQGS